MSAYPGHNPSTTIRALEPWLYQTLLSSTRQLVLLFSLPSNHNHKPLPNFYIPGNIPLLPLATIHCLNNFQSTLFAVSSHARTTTYYYYPKVDVLDPSQRSYEYITVTRDSPSPPPVSTPTLSHASTPRSSHPPTPQPPKATMARTPVVSFDPQVRAQRKLREDERAVCAYWSKHAAKCDRCNNPVEVWRRGGQLCEKGRGYAIDLAAYIYSKGGRPHSVIDKTTYGQRNEIEIPYEFDAVRDLVRAFDKGLTLNSYSKRPAPVISQDKTYAVRSRDAVPTIYITPNSSSRREREKYYDDNRRRTVHFDGSYRGSHYYADERARQERKRYEVDPVIILAEPRRSSRYIR